MKPATRIVIESLLAGIFLLLFIPHIPTWCNKVSGYDPVVDQIEAELNQRMVKHQQTMRDLQREIDVLDAKAGRTPKVLTAATR